MNVIAAATDTSRYAKCVEVSKRIRWEIERDVMKTERHARWTQRHAYHTKRDVSHE